MRHPHSHGLNPCKWGAEPNRTEPTEPMPSVELSDLAEMSESERRDTLNGVVRTASSECQSSAALFSVVSNTGDLGEVKSALQFVGTNLLSTRNEEPTPCSDWHFLSSLTDRFQGQT